MKTKCFQIEFFDGEGNPLLQGWWPLDQVIEARSENEAITKVKRLYGYTQVRVLK